MTEQQCENRLAANEDKYWNEKFQDEDETEYDEYIDEDDFSSDTTAADRAIDRYDRFYREY